MARDDIRQKASVSVRVDVDVFTEADYINIDQKKLERFVADGVLETVKIDLKDNGLPGLNIGRLHVTIVRNEPLDKT